jgi:enoyl-CoA hydratase/carnithine racemase
LIVRERHEDVEVLRLDRPTARNAMNTALLEALLGALDELAPDDGLRALVISTTSTAALSAGADVREELEPAGARHRMTLFTRLYAAIEAFPAPTIAVCVGNCVGAGAELAAGCDLRVAGDNLKLAWAGATHGVPVGPARLAPLIGVSRAKEIIFSSRVVGAQEALAIGLVHDAVAPGDAEPRALARAAALGNVRTLKRMFADLDDTAARVAHENGLLLDFERRGVGLPRAARRTSAPGP